MVLFWGVTPKGVKKKIIFNFLPHNSGTRIVSISSVTSDWIIISIFGCVLYGIFAFLLGWMAIDLEASIMAKKRVSGVGWRRHWVIQAFEKL